MLTTSAQPWWPELYSKSEHIWTYLDRVCRAFDLRKYMRFNSRVIEAVWDQEAGKWKVKVERTYADDSTQIFEDECVSLTICELRAWLLT